MKKIFLTACMMLIACTTVNAYSFDTVSNEKMIEYQNRIDNIGFKILNANGIERRTVFDYDASKTKNAYSRYRDRQIVIYKGMYNRLNSDDELAAVLAHEISHSVDSYNGVLRGYFTFWHSYWFFGSKKYETKADKRAVDYLVNAGYNPVAIIVAYSKTLPEERYEWCSTHPLTSKRMMNIYEYIYKKYPEYLVNNAYKNNMFYQNFLLTSKKERAKFQKEIENKKAKSTNI